LREESLFTFRQRTGAGTSQFLGKSDVCATLAQGFCFSLPGKAFAFAAFCFAA
jgi:hypothetical protein